MVVVEGQDSNAVLKEPHNQRLAFPNVYKLAASVVSF